MNAIREKHEHYKTNTSNKEDTAVHTTDIVVEIDERKSKPTALKSFYV